ncbi:hypothetical protein TNIN_270451 [Trichonephila inaurata madagascariensis]|uniref:Uncharacterized protein n=1 Tax=Trichonephila inaurata madagascariensis TaxID=2747483 RepID=A0A8X7C0S3_9ARAC|nr:hypothetical protein TNIN_270451 [Trichonephila inaurata madagascariensis]
MRGLKDVSSRRKPVQHFLMSVVRIECVSECPTHILDRASEAFSVQVGASTKGRAKVLERTSDEQGSDEGSKTYLLGAKPNISDVRGQVEDIILGNRETQNPGLDHLYTQPGNRSDFNIRHQALGVFARFDRVATLSLFRKGIECVSENRPTHILDRVRSLSVQVKAPKAS